MEVVPKITLIASIVFLGYNAYQLVADFVAVNEKFMEYRNLFTGEISDGVKLRISNFAISSILMLAYAFLAYFSGLAYGVSILIAVKLVFTLFLSDKELCYIIRGKTMNRNFFVLEKIDSFFNVLLGLSIALLLVL